MKQLLKPLSVVARVCTTRGSPCVPHIYDNILHSEYLIKLHKYIGVVMYRKLTKLYTKNRVKLITSLLCIYGKNL